MPETNPPVPSATTVSRKHTPLSLVWVVPIVAALLGTWVAVARYLAEGPTITIVFDSAEGLEAGKTTIHYNGVVVGTLEDIRLADDHLTVVATAQMAPDSRSFLVEDTRFWVVRPRISGANVSGLGTLVSGAYIGMEIGTSAKSARRFRALPSPPVVSRNVPGRFFVLKTSELGSLDYGTPLYFRRLQVGEVVSYALDPDGTGLTLRAFVKEPYDRYVTTETRFWHASGIDVSLSAAGLAVHTESLMSILVGGIAFETPALGETTHVADAEATFTLYKDHASAFQPQRGVPQTYVLVLRQSVRGLTVGAPVEFWGIPLGEVVDLRPSFDPKTFAASVVVTIHVYPTMLGVTAPDAATASGVAEHHARIEALIARGMRAQLRSGSLITGALFVAFDLFPDAPPVTIDWTQTPVELPVMPGSIAALEAQLTRIVHKLDTIPIEKIGADVATVLQTLDKTLSEARRTLAAAEHTLENAGTVVAPNSPLRSELAAMLSEVSRAARSLRVLTDYLERHPESLLRGKPGEAK
jgi:paraquat-inducible protein B